MKLIDQIVSWIAQLVMGVSAIVVLAVTFAQVLCRFVLKSPLPWSQDILRLAFTYLVFWGAAWCVRDKTHLNVDVLLSALPEKSRKVGEILINILLCAFFVFVIVVGFQFAMSGLTQTTSYLPLPMTVYYCSIPTAGILMLFYMLQNLAEQIKNFNKKEGEK